MEETPPTITTDLAKTIRGNLATVMLLTVAEVVVFYVYYKKRNEAFIDRTIRSFFRSNEAAIASVRARLESENRLKSLYAWSLRSRADRQHATREHNRQVMQATVAVCLLIGILGVMPFFLSAEPRTSEQWKSMLVRSLSSMLGVLISQYVLITFFFERIRGDFTHRAAEEAKDRIRRYTTTTTTCAPY